MTVERRIVAALADIKAIELECHACKRRIAMPPALFTQIPTRCGGSNCGAQWRPEKHTHTDTGADDFNRFAAGLQTLRLLTEQGALGFSILLVFDEPQRG